MAKKSMILRLFTQGETSSGHCTYGNHNSRVTVQQNETVSQHLPPGALQLGSIRSIDEIPPEVRPQPVGLG
eukprot:3444666-Pyramimonas_sp.AAC.1